MTGAAAAQRRRRRLGSTEPRLYTPPLRELTPETSLGFEVIEFATDVLRIELYPWQRWLLVHALELLPSGRLRFRNIVVLVARQNGKSTLSQVLALWWLYVCGCRQVLGTAQDLDTAEDVWEGALELIEATPELAELAAKPVKVNGKKAIRLITGERYRVKAASRRAGRGLTGDRILLDELREHTTWEAWGAITKTTMARPDAQVWCLSNAGDIASVVLRYLRKMAHKALGDPDGIVAADEGPESLLPDSDELNRMLDEGLIDDNIDHLDFEVDADDLGLFEWSAPPGCSRKDRNAWAQANPSMGYGSFEERTVASAARTDPEWVFRTEVLCQWSEGGLDGPFPPEAWTAAGVVANDDGKLPPADRINRYGRLVWGLDVSWNRSAAYVWLAGHRTSDDVPQLEPAARRYGVDWVVPWFTDPARPERKKRPIAIQYGSPAWALAEELIKAGCTVVELKGPDVPLAYGRFYDALTTTVGGDADRDDTGAADPADLEPDPQVRHSNDRALNLAAATAAVKVLTGDGWVVDRRKSPHDAAPLCAAVAAHWLIGRPKPPVVPPAITPQSIERSTAARNEIVTASF